MTGYRIPGHPVATGNHQTPEHRPYHYSGEDDARARWAWWQVHDVRARLRGETIIRCACPTIPRGTS